MNKKFKININVEIEYEADSNNYPGISDWKEMLEVDIEAAKDDPFIFLELYNPNITVTGEVLS